MLNLLLTSICCLLVSGLLYLAATAVLIDTTGSRGLGMHIAALSSTFLYSLHPVHMEVVGWPSAQPYVLGGTLTLLSLLAYLHLGHRRGGVCLSSLLYGASLLSKAAYLTAVPAFVTAIELLRLSRRAKLQRGQGAATLRLQAFLGIFLRTAPYLLFGVPLLCVSIWANVGGTNHDSDVVALTFQQRVIKAQVTMTVHHQKYLQVLPSI